jgi:hypothetical protein
LSYHKEVPKFFFLPAALFAFNAVGCSQPTTAISVTSEAQACHLAKNVVSTKGGYDAKSIAGCDFAEADDVPNYFVLRLNGYCTQEPICGSVLIGWYVVQKNSGQVFDWNVADWKIADEVRNAKN